MLEKLCLDTETYSLNTLPITIQYSIYGEDHENDEIHIVHLWFESPDAIIKLIESFLPYCIVGFNLSFDWFHLVKLYNICRQLEDQHTLLIDQFDEVNKTEDQEVK